MRAVIEEDLRTRTARAGFGHLPEIVRSERRTLVVADAHDALRWDADFILPDRIRLIVGLIDRDQQTILR